MTIPSLRKPRATRSSATRILRLVFLLLIVSSLVAYFYLGGGALPSQGAYLNAMQETEWVDEPTVTTASPPSAETNTASEMTTPQNASISTQPPQLLPDRVSVKDTEPPFAKEIKRRNYQLAWMPDLQPLVGDSKYLSHNYNAEDRLPFGHVMRDLGQRLLTRERGGAKDEQKVVVTMSDNTHQSVGMKLGDFATSEGHLTLAIDNDPRSSGAVYQHLDTWWQSFYAASERPFLMVIDQPSTQIFSSDGAAFQFLANHGPKHMVISVTATLHTDPGTNVSQEYTFEGSRAVEHLIRHHYKVQFLSATDFWNAHDFGYVWGTGQGPFEHSVFIPNALLNDETLVPFLKWGARAAATTKTLTVRQTPNITVAAPAIFKAYLYCTRGLDLAIPSRREYIINGTNHNSKWNMPYHGPMRERRQMVKRVNYKPCPDRNKQEQLEIQFRSDRKKELNPWEVIQVSCWGLDVTQAARKHHKGGTVELHLNNIVNASKAESACIKLNCQHMFNLITGNMIASNSSVEPYERKQVACTTRILPSTKHIQVNPSPLLQPQPKSPIKVNEYDPSDSNKKFRPLTISKLLKKTSPNILVVMMDSLSQSQFEFIMPQTAAMLRAVRSFVRFGNYTTVGDHAESNRMALFAGKRLENIREKDKTPPWIWDRLKELGYATFKAEDGCRTKSDMGPRNMYPANTTHGASLNELFCFHFARPNCVGSDLAAGYLLDHTKEFIDTYNGKSPWAAFVTLVDTREDSQTLGAVVDDSVMAFLNWTMSSQDKRENTLILFMSDQGLDYGPYYQSIAGERERSQPILYMRAPRSVGGSKRLVDNSRSWMTPLDVHATLQTYAGLPAKLSDGTFMHGGFAKSRTICKDASAIPKRHCEVLEKGDMALMVADVYRETPSPPSLMSFYADIPKDHRLKNHKCKPVPGDLEMAFERAKQRQGKPEEERADGKPCFCATSRRKWFPCDRSPWGRNGQDNTEENFLMVGCPDQKLHYQTRVIRNDMLVAKLRATTKQRSEEPPPPNILIIEVDSVSVQYADRHLPKTRELLRRYRPTADNTCSNNGLCAVDFSRFGVVGPNSITNQVASLSGCFTTNRHESCFDHESKIGDICFDPSLYEFGLRLQSKGPRDHTVYCPPQEPKPFLYDIAKAQGYVTFFGEEFCYPGSPWVLQDTVFPVKADIELHRVFCRLAKRRFPLVEEDKLYTYVSKGDKCTDGDTFGTQTQEIGLEMLGQMWDAYSDVPKFAYLNALAAHVYTANSGIQGQGAEEYDETLSTFLQSLFDRPDAHKTIVIVRSDHGLQGGSTHTVDYSTQIEQRHPWTEIIIPDTYPVDMLVKNSDKPVTPFDLYATVRSLLVGKKDHAPGIKTPSWFTNLLYATIDPNKSCKERKILPEYCPFVETPAPTFGVCNMFERGQAIFCRDPTNGGSLARRSNATDTTAQHNTELALNVLKGIFNNATTPQ